MDYFSDVLAIKWLVSTCLGAVVVAILSWVLKALPGVAMQWLLGGRVRRLKKIKRTRFNSTAVNYELVKAGVYFVLFLISIILTIFLIAITSFVGGVEVAYVPFVVAIYATPVFIFEVLWLEQNFLVISLARYNPYFHKGKQRVNRVFPRSVRRDKQRMLRRVELNSLKYRSV